MNRFKLSLQGRPKYVYEPETKTTKCILRYDVTDLRKYIMEGPAGVFEYNPETKERKFTPAPNTCGYQGKEDNQYLGAFAEAVIETIARRLSDKGVLKFNNGSLYVEGVAKFNPEDSTKEFHKLKGRAIAYAKAQDELLRITCAILGEMSNLSMRLDDCTSWMLNGMPKSINERLEESHQSIMHEIDRPVDDWNKMTK